MMQHLLSQNMEVTVSGRCLNDHIHVARSVKAIQLQVNTESNVHLNSNSGQQNSTMNCIFTGKLARNRDHFKSTFFVVKT